MGILRLILATIVVLAHTQLFGYVGGLSSAQIAVQMFFIISGFLISYILTDLKSYSKVSHFYFNRFVRLYPAYFFICSLTLFFYFFEITENSAFFETYKSLPANALIYLFFTNATLLFQDLSFFLAIENSNLVFSSNYLASSNLIPDGLLIGPAWTLGIEISFYILAPFIIKKKKILFFFLSLSLSIFLVNRYINHLGHYDPWTYRFFPTQLSLFLLGAISHQFLKPLYNYIFAKKLIASSNIFTFIFISFLLIYFYICSDLNMHRLAQGGILYGCLLFMLPFLFTFNSKYRFDRYIGNLSYPVYLVHELVMKIGYFIGYLKQSEPGIDSLENAIIVLIMSIVFSIIFNHTIESRVSKLRARYRKKII